MGRLWEGCGLTELSGVDILRVFVGRIGEVE